MRTDDSDSADWVSTGTAPRTVTRSSVAGDDDSPAADVPAQNVTLSVTNRPTDRLLWSLRGRAVRRDGRPGPVEVVTPGFATLHVLAGWEFVRGFQAQALLTNLFDEAYRETPDPVAVLAPGRAFSLALSGRF
jgi:outer membrane receptor protein involved in Fe transport